MKKIRHPTKATVKYRAGPDQGHEHCDRCVHFIRRNLFCWKLGASVERKKTCDMFIADPDWAPPYVKHARIYSTRK